MRTVYDNMTVGYLKKFIENNKIPDDAVILTQRIEDVYFNKHGWETVKKEGNCYNDLFNTRQKAIDGEYDNKDDYPLMTEEKITHLKNILEDDINSLKDQYHPIWCPVKYKDDNNLYLDLHY